MTIDKFNGKFKFQRGIAAYDFHDHYAVLGLPLNASSQQIRNRYLQIAKCLHPDVCAHANPEQAVKFLAKLVNPSYNLLIQERERTEYEAILKLLAKRLMKKREQITPAFAVAQHLLKNPSNGIYIQAVQDLAKIQYADFDRVIERTEHLSELNLVFALVQEGYSPVPSFQSGETPPPEHIKIQMTTPVPAPNPMPPQSDQLLQQAEQFIQQKQWTMALKDLRTVIQLEPSNSSAHALLGVVYSNQKLQGMAKISFQQALKYDPQNSIALRYIHQITESDSSKDKNKKTGFFGWLGGG